MLGANRRPLAHFCLRRTADATADSGRPRGGGRVPVTARLSKRFYDVFGEEIATELVDWFNAVDATYRADLRELNELNFSRFDAKLEQRLATLDAKLEQRLAELRVELVKELEFRDRKSTRLNSSHVAISYAVFCLKKKKTKKNKYITMCT